MTVESNVTEIKADKNFSIEAFSRKPLNVAAYCRVSTGSDEQLNSLSSQIEYYTNFINKNPKWTLVGIYSDEGVSGTGVSKRKGFMSLIKDSQNGKIDLILTKSVSRFSRNIVDSIYYIRMLKLMNINIYFEEENINTLDIDEYILGLCSVMAQAESENISANVKWGIEKRMKEGKYKTNFSIYGYRRGKDGIPVIVEEEAEIIRSIFKMYLDGLSSYSIAEKLNNNSECNEKVWNKETVRRILQNEKYIGNILLQKTFSEGCIRKNIKANKGELPQYLVENNHPAIIEKEIFELAQAERIKRNSKKEAHGKYSGKYALSQLLVCGDCGSKFRRNVKTYKGEKKVYWRCSNRRDNGKSQCSSNGIKEEALHKAICRALNKVAPDKKYVIDSIVDTLESEYSELMKSQQIISFESKIKYYEEQIEFLSEQCSESYYDEEGVCKELKQLKLYVQMLRDQIKILEEDKNNKIIEFNGIITSLHNMDISFYEYDDVLVRRLVEKIVLNDSIIIICLKNGEEIIENIKTS